MDILNLTRLISERAVPPLTPLPLTHLGYYDQLRHHRCFITHGILTVALGNIAHLQRTQRRLGHDDLSNPAFLGAVQDAMLRDQASEPNAGRRWLLGVATWAPWNMVFHVDPKEGRSRHTPSVVDWLKLFRKSDYTHVVAGLLRLYSSGRLSRRNLAEPAQGVARPRSPSDGGKLP